MVIRSYDEMSSMELDVIKEIGSIGTGNAATALSSLLSEKVQITLPEVSINGFDETVKKLGDPEDIVMAVLAQMSGEINGIMLFLLKLDLINVILGKLLNRHLNDYWELDDMGTSALNEIGNIMISSYINAMATLTSVEITLSVPATAVNMLGGILSVPMSELGYTTDKLMTISGQFIIGDKKMNSDLLLLPDVASLNLLMKKLGVDVKP